MDYILLSQTVYVYLQPLSRNWPPKTTEFGRIKENNSHYAIQGHSRSPILARIENPYATSN